MNLDWFPGEMPFLFFFLLGMGLLAGAMVAARFQEWYLKIAMIVWLTVSVMVLGYLVWGIGLFLFAVTYSTLWPGF